MNSGNLHSKLQNYIETEITTVNLMLTKTSALYTWKSHLSAISCVPFGKLKFIKMMKVHTSNSMGVVFLLVEIIIVINVTFMTHTRHTARICALSTLWNANIEDYERRTFSGARRIRSNLHTMYTQRYQCLYFQRMDDAHFNVNLRCQ